MFNQIRRVIVTRVTAGDAYKKIQPKVYVSYLDGNVSTASETLANFSSIVPTSSMGSASLSLPKTGQQCLAFVGGGMPIIFAYIPGGSIGGNFTPEGIDAGAFALAGGAATKMAFKFDPNRGISMNTGMFTEIDLDALDQSLKIKADTYKFYTPGSSIDQTWDKKENTTSWIQVFTKDKETLQFTDRFEKLETPISPEILYLNTKKYTDKAIIRAGAVADENIVYQLETRQGYKPFLKLPEPSDKDIFTSLRAGFQLKHTREGKIKWDGGSLYEWIGKKNTPGEIDTFLQRFGSLLDGEQKGEAYRLQIYTNHQFLTPSPLGAPLKIGKGWEYDPKTDAELVYINSVGILADKSIKREFLTQNFSKTEKFSLEDQYLGIDGIHTKHIIYKDIETYSNLNQDGSVLYSYSNKEGSKAILSELFGQEGHLKLEIKDSEYGALLNLNKGVKITYDEGGKSEILDLTSDNLVITLSSGVSLSIGKGSFTLNVGKSTFVIDEGGNLTFNGLPLAFGAIVDLILTSGAPGIGISGAPGTPAPLHPKMIADLNTGKKLPTNNQKALLTKV